MNPSLACYQHVSQNLELFGFGTDVHSSSLQTFKELVDNAYEATRHQVLPEISIALNQISNTLCVLDVIDNGIGFPHLDFISALSCLSSTRQASHTVGDTSFGRFGCGLSASLIYSLQSTGQTMRIISKQSQAIDIRIAEVSLDPKSGQGAAIRSHYLLKSSHSRHP